MLLLTLMLLLMLTTLKVIRFNIFEAFLKEAVFPEKLKIAEVIPVFKKSEKENVENY